MLREQFNYKRRLRWLGGLNLEEDVWVPTVFRKNRDRLLAGDVAQAFFDAVLVAAQDLDRLSAEHFSVDETLIEAWAGRKSFQRRMGADPGLAIRTVVIRPSIFTARSAATTAPHRSRREKRDWRARAMAKSPSCV
jgi:hypothetical protein